MYNFIILLIINKNSPLAPFLTPVRHEQSPSPLLTDSLITKQNTGHYASH